MPNTNVAEWMLVLLCVPGQHPKSGGILLLDPSTGHLALKLKTDIFVEDEALSAFWSDLECFLKKEEEEKGGQLVVEWLETTASHVLQLSARNRIELTGRTLLEALETLYYEHIQNPVGSH